MWTPHIQNFILQTGRWASCTLEAACKHWTCAHVLWIQWDILINLYASWIQTPYSATLPFKILFYFVCFIIFFGGGASTVSVIYYTRFLWQISQLPVGASKITLTSSILTSHNSIYVIDTQFTRGNVKSLNTILLYSRAVKRLDVLLV